MKRAAIPKGKPQTLNHYLDDWLEQKALESKPRTVEIYAAELEHVRKRLGRKKLAQIKPPDVPPMMRDIVGSKVTYTYHKTEKKEH